MGTTQMYSAKLFSFFIIAKSFIKIKLHKVGGVLVKVGTTYAIFSFGTLQFIELIINYIALESILGISASALMQITFLVLIAGFPITIISTFISRKKILVNTSLQEYDSIKEIISNKKPRLGIIPFENLNDGEGSTFLVDGIVEDLITELSMIKEISVATRKTSFSLRNADYTSTSFKNEWGFDYVVSGSIRSIGDRIRVSVELSDMTDDEAIWSQKYDKVKSDVFSLQDEIVRQIIHKVIGEIEISSLNRAHRKPTDNMTSYEYTLKGRALNQKFEKSANAEAIKMLNAAIEADPTNPLPHSWKACTLGQAIFLGFKDKDEAAPAMLESLSRANELNDNDWNTNRILAETHLTINDFEATKYYALKAYKANPNNPAVLSIYGQSLLNNGDIKSAIQVFEKLHDLEPITAADNNSDRVIQAKLFAYYADRNINKCDELVDQLETLNSKTWISMIDLYRNCGERFIDKTWFTEWRGKFSSIDWKKEIDSFHLNDRNMLNSLLESSTLIPAL